MVFRDLVRAQIELWDAVDTVLRREHDLPLGRFEAMDVVAERPGCRVQDVASTLVITVGGASKLIDRVEAAGHCVRRPHPADGRSSSLHLTSAGESVRAAARGSLEDELRRRLDPLIAAGTLTAFAAALSALRATTEETTR